MFPLLVLIAKRIFQRVKKLIGIALWRKEKFQRSAISLSIDWVMKKMTNCCFNSIWRAKGRSRKMKEASYPRTTIWERTHGSLFCLMWPSCQPNQEKMKMWRTMMKACQDKNRKRATQSATIAYPLVASTSWAPEKLQINLLFLKRRG